jgi:hypothetical protein
LSSVQSSTVIKFLHVDNPEIVAFVAAELRSDIEAPTEKELLENIRRYAFYAEQDINDDGVPEWIVSYQNRGAGWCGTAGCPSYIFRRIIKEDRREGYNEAGSSVMKIADYEKICEAMMTGFDPPSWVLGKKENGYHLIDTGGGEVIRWAAQKDSSGQLCEVVDKPDLKGSQ